MENSKVKAFIKEYVPYIAIIILVILIKRYIVAPVKVNGSSMMDTLHNGDIMILNNTAYYFDDIKRFDIVVVRENKEYIIKRVIGLPGEEVLYRSNVLYIDGHEIENEYDFDTDDFSLKTIYKDYFHEESHYVYYRL